MPAIYRHSTRIFRAVGEYGSVVIVASNIPYKDLIAAVLIFQRLSSTTMLVQL
jgi:sulfate transport system permease protein